ncbi:MAG: 7TM diverse intracellular signaling domain-containing protein [Polaromonas sp.]
MKYFLSIILLVLMAGLPPVQAQAFDRLNSDSLQPALTQPLQWVSAPVASGANLPYAFSLNPQAWAFAPYTAETVLPTSGSTDVWLKFTLAATPLPQSWIVRIPRVTIRKVSLYSSDANGFEPVQSAGTALAHSAWNRSTRTPSFELITSNIEKTYFLHLENSTPVTERPQLMSQADFAEGAARVGILIGLMFGMLGLLILACLAAFAMSRNGVFISLASLTAAILLQYLVQIGYGNWRIWPHNAQLNQAMLWTAPMLVLATACWFFALASYARDTSKSAYRLLYLVAGISLALGFLRLVSVELVPPHYFNGWAAFVIGTIVLTLLWLTMRQMRSNWWLAMGSLPLAAAGFSRVVYNYGWLAQIELAMAASVFMTQAGLVWLFLWLAWRGRAALLSNERATALNNYDAATGLIQERVALLRLPQMLRRAAQLKLGCGVIMLRWNNHAQMMRTQNPEQFRAMLKHIGQVLNRVARDVDTAARLDDGYFLILVEGPISRSTLSSVSTQVLSTCIRASDKFKLPNGFDFHIAIWQATDLPVTAAAVLETLRTRLYQMAFGTKRRVQFVDMASSDLTPEPDTPWAQRRDDLVAKIDAIEASSSVQAVLMPEEDKK